jgi:hypothetical protein
VSIESEEAIASTSECAVDTMPCDPNTGEVLRRSEEYDGEADPVGVSISSRRGLCHTPNHQSTKNGTESML